MVRGEKWTKLFRREKSLKRALDIFAYESLLNKLVVEGFACIGVERK